MTDELFSRTQLKDLEFPTDYPSILQRLDEIDPLAYGRTRNFIDGAVTYLSPYISRGVISVKQIQEGVLSKGFPPSAITKFLQELAWREYFQRVWQVKGDTLLQDIRQPQANVLHHEMIDAIDKASTGISAIDNLIKDFYKTGYMHNHVRMYIASITCNIGRANWSAPAKWMYYHLLDGDLASNVCSWQWVAGSFASKKYHCNQENINRHLYSSQRNTFLDWPVESLADCLVPDALKKTSTLNLTTVLPETTMPIIDITKPTLIYNSYNLDPQWRKEEDLNRLLLLEPSHLQKYPVSKRVMDFVLSLSKNIAGLQIMVGEVSELEDMYKNSPLGEGALISKEHPAFTHYPGIKDSRAWLYPTVTGYSNSFFSFWKKCEKQLHQHTV
jgi:deoxyribodipyrimidine photo-lyase